MISSAFFWEYPVPSYRVLGYTVLQARSFVMPTARERGYRTRYKHIHVRSARAIEYPKPSIQVWDEQCFRRGAS